ncbi:helix-turn-helix domain-containing protein [Amedibacterium intestinale]|uniref:helix-turn-helix domain-containing protein n=1 Tax=Amedibacterium intestinale TaxID=2583452 RepID=UPI000E1FFA1E
MFEILLVEPDKTMIQIYKNMIPWENYSFRITSVTDNETQAISYYGEYAYSLVITEINLKKGDGISLIRKLKKLDENCLIVVVSNEEKYTYIHDSFRLGVNDYILKKDIKYNVLVNILIEVKEKIKNNQNNIDWQNDLGRQLGYLRDNQEVGEHKIKELLHHEELRILDQMYCMALIRMDNVRQVNKKLKIYDNMGWLSEEEYILLYKHRIEQREELQKQIMHCINYNLTTFPYIQIFIKKHSCLLIFPANKRGDFLKESLKLKNELEKECHNEFSITIGKIAVGKKEFIENYMQLNNVQKKKFFLGDSCIVDAEKIYEYTDIKIQKTIYHRKLINSIKHFDGDSCIYIINDIIRFVKDNKINEMIIKKYFIDIFEFMQKIIKTKEFENLSVQKEAVRESESIDFLSYELERIFKTFRDQFKKIKKTKNNPVAIVDKYIEEHLSCSLSPDKVAGELGISRRYISMICKQETGYTLSGLIKIKKLEKAKELLLTTNIAIKEVAKQVGYKDPLYFSRIFEQEFKTSPRNYRKYG